MGTAVWTGPPVAWKKELDDARIGEHRVPSLLMQEDTCRLHLEPVGRSAPGAEGVVDLYLMPAYDDIATLYYYNGRWNLHYFFPRAPEVAAVRNTEAMPLSKETFAKVLAEMSKMSLNYEWQSRIKAVEREYVAMRQAADRFPANCTRRSDRPFEGNPRHGEIVVAANNLEGMYIIRLFAEFETGARQYWGASWDYHPKTAGLLDGLAARWRNS